MADDACDFYLDLSTCNFQSSMLIFDNLLLLFQSGYSQDEMFEYFNCGIDYLLIIDHTKISVENLLQQFTQIHSQSFLLGTFHSISKRISTDLSNEILLMILDSTPTRNKTVRVPQPSRTRTVQLKNIVFKYPKPSLTSTNTSVPIKDRMKQPIANDKTRCAILISTNGK